jgi:uncharacterized protein YndB with AHSA1/START domain
MIVVEERVRLPAPADRVWSWFANLDSHYRDWHPEHLAWRTLRGEPLTEGAVVFVDEWLGPFRLSGRSFLHDVVPERRFSFRLGPPGSLVRAGGSFGLAPAPDGGTDLTQQARLGYGSRGAEHLLDRALGRALPVDEIRRHMREEQRNLAAILSSPSPDGRPR